MSRIYVQVEGGADRVLVRIECDQEFEGCHGSIKPGPHVVGSGWIKYGIRYDIGDGHATERYACPNCKMLLDLA